MTNADQTINTAAAVAARIQPVIRKLDLSNGISVEQGLHSLRNPYGWDPESVRAVRPWAAEMIEMGVARG